MSWMTELYERGWASNGLRFETKAEADEYGLELRSRWSIPTDSRAIETPNEAVTHKFDFILYKAVRLE